MNTLKPCPFCGYQPITEKVANGDGLMVECMCTSCPVQPHVSYIPPESAITAWNTRSTGSEATREVLGGWQPIETAPKVAGKKVLLFTVWHGSAHCPAFSESQIGYWEEAVNAPMRHEDAGWRKEYIGEPTHWMPLPEPPALAAISGEGI